MIPITGINQDALRTIISTIDCVISLESIIYLGKKNIVIYAK